MYHNTILISIYNLAFKLASPPKVFGHGWLCHPTSPRGRLSENFSLSSGFVIQEVKVQTLLNFYDNLYQ